MSDHPPPAEHGPDDCFETECHLCGTEEELVPDPNFDFLYLCRNCLGHWEDHQTQIVERDEPPPTVE